MSDPLVFNIVVSVLATQELLLTRDEIHSDFQSKLFDNYTSVRMSLFWLIPVDGTIP